MKPLPAVLLLATGWTSGCATEYHAMHFLPEVIEAPVEFPEAPRASANALAGVHGVRRADADVGRPDGIEIELTIENTGDVPLEWSPSRMTLEDAAHVRLDAPEVHAIWPQPEGPLEVAGLSLRLEPGERAESCVTFPVRDASRNYGIDDLDLSEIHLSWTLSFDGGRSVRTNAQFGRGFGVWRRGGYQGSLGATCW